MVNVIRTITVRGSSEGLDKLTADIKRLAAAEQGLAVVSDDLTKSQLSLEQQLKRQTLRLDEAARAQANIDREIRLSERGVKQKLKTDEEHLKTVELVNQRYAVSTVQVGNLTKASSRAGAEMLNLSRQFADVGVSLQAGQSPFTVLVQQGAQIVDVFAASNRSVGSFFTQAAGWAGRFVMSTGGVITGLAAIGGGAVYAGMAWAEGQRDIERALTGIGKRSGATVKDINEIAEASAKSSKLSVSESRDAATEFAKTGNIYTESITGVMGLVDGFSKTIGKSSKEAAEQLAQIFSGDLVAGAEKLDSIFGSLDGKTLKLVADLQAQNKQQEAIAVLVNKITPQIQEAANVTGFWSASWNAVSNSSSNFFDRLGKNMSELTGIGEGPQKQLENLNKQFEMMESNAKVRQQARELGGFSIGVDVSKDQAGQLRNLLAEMARLEDQAKRSGDAVKQMRMDVIGKEADAAVRALLPEIDQLRQLKTALEDIQRAQEKLAAGGNTNMGYADQLQKAGNAGKILEDRIEGIAAETARANANGLQLKETYGTTTVEAGRTLDALKNQAEVAGAVGGAAQMAAQEQARFNQLIREGKDAEDAARIAAAERKVTQIQINTASKEATWNLQNQLPVAEAVGGAAKLAAQEEARYNQLVHAGVSANQAAAQAAAERAVAQAQINSAAQETLQIMIYQRGVAEATTGSQRISAQALATANTLIFQGVAPSIARATAAEQEYQARAQVSAQLKEQAFQLNQQAELIEARTNGTEAGLKAEQAYTNALRAGASQSAAAEMSAAVQRNEDAEEAERLANQRAQANSRAAAQAEREAAAYAQMVAESQRLIRALQYIPLLTLNLGRGTQDLFESPQGGYSQFDPQGYTSSWKNQEYYFALQKYGQGGFDENTGAPNAQGLEYQYNKTNRMGGVVPTDIMESPHYEQSEVGLFWKPSGMVDMNKVSLAQRAIGVLPEEQQIAPLRDLIKKLEEAPYSLATAEAIQSLNQKLEQLTQATEENTSATQTMTDVLSPFYSSDPRRTHLGFRSFAGGGIMSQYGELPLRNYQSGGIATSPQVAVFGEGSTPEAYVPVPGGQIPVVIKTPANSNRPVNVTINVMGNADAGTVAALKQTSFQKAQQLRRITG